MDFLKRRVFNKLKPIIDSEILSAESELRTTGNMEVGSKPGELDSVALYLNLSFILFESEERVVCPEVYQDIIDIRGCCCCQVTSVVSDSVRP